MHRVLSLTASLLCVCSATAGAQLQRTFHVSAGVTGGTGVGVGAGAQLAFELRPHHTRFGVRVDASHHQWRDGLFTGQGSYRASMATANVVARLPEKVLRPYALAGVGAYALQGESARLGWNVGGGLELQRGRYRLFAESRAHFVRSTSDQRITPLVIGFRF